MSKHDFSASRRRFAAQLLQGASFLAASLGTGRRARAAQAAIANPDPRFLVNVHTRGGMDSMWWHSYVTSDDITAYLTASSSMGQLNQWYTDRFPKDQAIPHPSNPNHLMGIGMSVFSSDDIAKMAIVKGVVPVAGHDIGNRIINCGQFTNYAASFSSLISIDLALKSPPLPLHYVQISDGPEALYTWPGLLSGYAIAVNIPDQAAFANLTGTLPGEFDAARRTLLGKTMSDLAAKTMSSGFRLSQSRDYYQSFLSSFQAMGVIYGSGLANSPEFLGVINHYVQTAISEYQALLARYSGFLPSTLAYTGGSDAINNPASDYYKQIQAVAFSFGMAEYLITHNLSRVVDVGPVSCSYDAHTSNSTEFNGVFLKYVMFRELMRRLSAAECPGTGGHNYLQQTTMVMTTEFERTPAESLGRPGEPYGTNHGAAASFILAGRGVRGGAVAGDIKTSPGAYGKYAAYADTYFMAALPMNVAAGGGNVLSLDSGGKKVTTQWIMPTVMGIFGVNIPLQQITEGQPLLAVMT